MGFVEAVCTKCGGSLNVDESREFGYCPYCGTQYFTEKIINNTYVTNNYTMNVQGADIGNYITLIDKYISLEKYDEAEQYLRDALPMAPDDEQLSELQLRLYVAKINLAMSEKEYDEAERLLKDGFLLDPCSKQLAMLQIEIFLDKALNSPVDELIPFMEFYEDSKEAYNILAEDFEKSVEIYSHTIDFLIKLRHKLRPNEAACYTIVDLSSYKKDEYIIEQKKNQRKMNYMLCGIATIYFCSDPIASDAAIDAMLKILLEECEAFEQKSSYGLSFIGQATKDVQLTKHQIVDIVKAELGGKELKGKNKKREERDARLGTYVIYYIKKNHPNYHSQILEELEKKMLKMYDKQSCYVATCVYGSYDCPQVWTLRRFRDYTLATSWYGRGFIRLYYATSPTLVGLIGDMSWFKTVAKHQLDKMVSMLNKDGIHDTPYIDQQW